MFSPDGKYLLFDRQNQDGYYNLYISDLNGNIVQSVTKGKNILQLNNGNGVFYPNPAAQYVGFISEAAPHFLSTLPPSGPLPLGDPGVGLFANFWFTDGLNFSQETQIPVKQTATDGIPTYATVNPRFKPDGSIIVWTERYQNGADFNWGFWHLNAADIVPGTGTPVALSVYVAVAMSFELW